MSNLTIEQKEQIGAEIENQGLGYWITNYGRFYGDDPDLKILIKTAKKAINKLESYMIKNDIIY